MDARFVASILEHFFQSAGGAADVISPSFFFPQKHALAYSDVHLITAVPYAVFRACGASVLSALAAAIIALSAATWIVTYLFLHLGVRLGPIAAFAGAYLFVFSSPKLNQMSHLQHQVLLLVPAMAWSLLAFVRAAEAGRDRRSAYAIAGFSLLFQLQLWTSFQIAWFWAFQLCIALALAVACRSHRLSAVRWVRAHPRGVLAFVGGNLVALLPFLALFQPTAIERGWRQWEEVVPSLPLPLSYVTMGPNLVWEGRLPPSHARLPVPWEHSLGFGVIATAFGLASFCWAVARYARWGLPSLVSRDTRCAQRDLAVLGALTTFILLLATLNVSGTSAWRFAYLALPGAAAIRTVSRCVLLGSLGVSLVAAYAVESACARLPNAARGRRLALAILLTVAIGAAVVEQLGHPAAFDRKPPEARVESLVGRLRRRPLCEVFAVDIDPRTRAAGSNEAGAPIRTARIQIDAMLASLATGRPTMNGYSSLSPPGWNLWRIGDPTYRDLVREWSTARGLLRRTCILSSTP
ncbi:MAG TPA: hypothetical protein VFD92_02550 [Candidatus Binatia bacterium]|nr:hypothetical protein [Candidatus Binatia bacterium]